MRLRDESVADEARRKRLYFRCWHRGTREVDLLVGPFADRHLDTFSAEQLDRLERLLEVSDVDLYAWVVGRAPVPAEHDHDVMKLLMGFESAAQDP
jgi:antitoxin CptB